MERVTGISGLVVAARDPERLSRWYADHLGVETAIESGETAPSQARVGVAVFTAVPAGADHLDSPAETFAVTFAVDDLDAMVSQLRDGGVQVDLDPGPHPDGPLASLRDPEGNAVRLWQPTSRVDQPWSSEPVYVQTIGEDGPEPVARQPRPAWPRSSRWFPLVLAGLIAVVAITAIKGGREPPESPAADTAPPTRSSATHDSTTPQEGPVVDEVGGGLLGVRAGWEVFAHGSGGVVRMELARGRITRTPVTFLRSTGPVSFLVGPDRVLIRPMDSVPGYVVPDEKPARSLPPGLDHGGMIFEGPRPGQVWLYSGAHNQQAMTLFTLDGRKIGRNLPLPKGSARPIASDGTGYLVVEGTGGVYLARSDGLHRITTGAVLAVGPTRFLTLECDKRSRCSRVVIDRATGSRRVLTRDVGHENPTTPGVISPDGSMAAVFRFSSRFQHHHLHLLDLASGADHRLNGSIGVSVNGQHGMVWSPDSRWLLIADGKLLAVDARTRRIRELDAELPSIEQVAVRATSEP